MFLVSCAWLLFSACNKHFELSFCVSVSDCICLCSVSISVTSIDPVGLRCSSHYVCCYQFKLAAQGASLQPVVAAEVEATEFGSDYTALHIVSWFMNAW